MKLQVHTLKPPARSRRPAKKRGRGNASGHGNYSGHGGKGQTARSGGARGLRLKSIKRLMQSTPKLRGFKSLRTKPAEVYLGDLEKHYASGETVNVASLIEKKIIGVNDQAAKILNKGEITKKLIVAGVKATASAKEKIIKAGGELK